MRTENQKRTAEMLQLFDNNDLRLPFYELRLERELTDLIDIPMPSGYHLVTYQPGDRDAWIGIEKSAREFTTWEEGMAAWQKYYEGHDEELKSRMFFAVNSCGKKVATATAFYDIRTGDDGINGWLHWVAVCREAQGCGLSKPLINHVLHYMKELGYRHAVIPTQTTTWLACKVYLDMGFRPVSENAESSIKGWEIIRNLTAHPALETFSEVDVTDFLKMRT